MKSTKEPKKKKRMLTSSLKAKGRTLCKTVKERILAYFPEFSEEDIKVTSSGATGEDLTFSASVRSRLPISIECKKHGKFALYKHYKQAEANANGNEPVLVIEQDRSKPLAIVDLEYFIYLHRNQLTSSK